MHQFSVIHDNTIVTVNSHLWCRQTLTKLIISAKWTEWTGEILCDAVFRPSVLPPFRAHSVFRCKYLENGLS